MNAPTTSPECHRPDLRDVIGLPVPTGVRVAPDAARVAIAVATTNWKDDRYEAIAHVHEVATGRTRRLTRDGSVSRMEWLDTETLAVLRSGPGDEKPQVWVYEGLTGDGWKVTDPESGVDWFRPFAGGILYRARDPEREKNEARTDRFGKFVHFETEESASGLYYLDLPALREHEERVRASTEKEAEKLVRPVLPLHRLLPRPLSIQGIAPSPLGDSVCLTCWPHDDLVHYRGTSGWRISLDPAAALREQRERAGKKQGAAGEEGGEKVPEDFSWLGTIVELPVPRGSEISTVSPDGTELMLVHRERDGRMFTRSDQWVIDLESALKAPDPEAFLAAMRNLTGGLDRQIVDGDWVESGIFTTYVDRTRVRVARFREGGPPETLRLGEVGPDLGIHVSRSGAIGYVGTDETTFPDVHLAEPEGEGGYRVRRLTDFGAAVKGWDVGTTETIRWTSRDGTEIDGVLRKPSDFDPSKRYPLAVVVHGGPKWFSPAYAFPGEERRYYPAAQFVNEGILVLKPNYRGSLGRGQAFAELNVDNLGVGDQWDVESGVEHLVDLGWVDPDRVGCMGWSQGGYISAFLGLHSTKFRAVSVGAGISDWYTYHLSNDIPAFTVDYLSGSPFRDRTLYEKTSPMAGLRTAKTPMLIQHGAEDRRVPFSNATELYRGLREMGVPVELFVFPGMGHPITKPRENHAVMQQNLAWFRHHLLGAELDLP